MNKFNRTILCVDDNYSETFLLKKILEKEPYNYLIANSGEEALELLKTNERQIDLIIMDIELGAGMDGIQTAEEILKIRNLPIIFLSAHSEKEFIERIESISAYGYFIKGGPPSILRSSIKMAFRLFDEKLKVFEHERISSTLLSYVSVGIATISINLYFTSMNDSFKRLMCLNRGDNQAKSITSIFNDNCLIEDFIETAYQNGSSQFEYPINSENIETTLLVTIDKNFDYFAIHSGYIITVSDITENKKISKELKNSHLIFKHSLDMLCIAGFDGYFKVLNPSWERTLGWSTEELLSKPWIDFVHPDDVEETKNIRLSIVDGTEVYQFINRYICKDGRTKWLSWNSFPYPEQSIIYGVAHDITEKIEKEHEVLKYQQELYETEKMKTIAHIATGIAHEFNNILSIIQLKSQMSLIDSMNPLSSSLQKTFKDIDDTVKRGSEVVKSLMSIARPTSSKKQYVYSKNLIDTVVNVMQIQLKKDSIKISIVNKTEKYILVDQSELYQVFLNLIINASHALKNIENPTIDFEITDTNENVIITCTDNGSGINKEIIDLIFNPFFTTKSAESENNSIKGNGLGLFISRLMIENNGGELTVESELGNFTKFIIKFPNSLPPQSFS